MKAECASPGDAFRDQVVATLPMGAKLGGKSSWSAPTRCRTTAG
jgi:hypothetical protein